jgi:TolB-like protein/DNA-binding winged helix-turn-helix (wHTH) protein/Flp pilus assembly protein TadD
MLNKGKGLLEFGNFRLDATQQLLFSGDQLVALAPKAFDTLQALIEADGRIVGKEELLKKVWPDTFVEEGSLAHNISILRKVLAESADDQKYIQTIPKRGYRFVAPVKATDPGGAAVVEEHTQVQAAFDIETDSGEREGSAPTSASRRWRIGARPATVLAVVGVVGVLAWEIGAFKGRDGGGKAPRIHSLAVLPLENLSRDSGQDYFSDGITDALITSIAQIDGLQVISRTSAMRYKKTTKSIPQIAQELGVDGILEGTIQREGNRVRISAQLLRAATDTHLWAKDYEFDLSNLLKLEGDVATAIAHEIQSRVTPTESQRLARRRVISPAAQDLYMEGRDHEERRDERNLAQAIQRYEKAIAIQPDFAAAYAGLARAWFERGISGAVEFRQSEAPARQAALRALELDSKSADAHAVIAYVAAFHDWDWATAEAEYRRAIGLNPNSVYAHLYFGVSLEALGRFSEAIQEEQRAIALDPVSSVVESEYARVLFRARKFDESIRHFQRAIELDPQNTGARTRLADVYEQTGKFQEAVVLSEGVLRLPDGTLRKMPDLARAYALAGRRADALDVLTHLGGPGASPRWFQVIALTYFALGDRDRGFQWLTKAFDERQTIHYVKVDPRFDSVRDDPRFDALVRRLGLPQNP